MPSYKEWIKREFDKFPESPEHLNDAPKSILTKAFNELTRIAQENAATLGEQVDHAKLFDDMVSMRNQLRYDPYHRTTNQLIVLIQLTGIMLKT
jgi:hypothetical protein